MTPREIQVHIEELVLHGFSRVDAPNIRAAVARELERLFVEGGVPQALLDAPARESVDAGRIGAAPGHGASDVGTEVARSVYRGMAR